MRKSNWILILFLGFTASCCKDKLDPPHASGGSGCHDKVFAMRTTSDFDYIKEALGYSWTGPVFVYPEPYNYNFLTNNPGNDKEIAFARDESGSGFSLNQDICTYSFCNNQTKVIANNFYYNLDWSSKDWLIYTGTNHWIYKVKSNGDSLTVLSQLPGYNRAGKWNPSGTLYWNVSDAIYINNEFGDSVTTIQTVPFQAYDWLDDSTLLGVSNSFFCSLNINTEALNIISHEIQYNGSPYNVGGIYDRDKSIIYSAVSYGTSNTDYVFRYYLDGSMTYDTMRPMYDSYHYGIGFIENEKYFNVLTRKEPVDTTNIKFYYRSDIIYIDLTTGEDRMMMLP